MSHPPEPEHVNTEEPDPLAPIRDLASDLTDDWSLVLSKQVGRIVDATWGTLRTPNEYDSNGEPANVVDGLYAIARAIHHLARAHEGVRTEIEHDDYHVAPIERPFREPEDRGKVRIPDQLVAPRRRPAASNGHR